MGCKCCFSIWNTHNDTLAFQHQITQQEKHPNLVILRLSCRILRKKNISYTPYFSIWQYNYRNHNTGTHSQRQVYPYIFRDYDTYSHWYCSPYQFFIVSTYWYVESRAWLHDNGHAKLATEISPLVTLMVTNDHENLQPCRNSQMQKGLGGGRVVHCVQCEISHFHGDLTMGWQDLRISSNISPPWTCYGLLERAWSHRSNKP